MNINQKALDLFENNEYDEAFELFQRAVYESRNIQSLNNLAWIYCYEEEDDEKALELIKEVIDMKPTSYFPYNILGEICIKQKKWQLASVVLQDSISIYPSNEALHNLAVAKYHLRDFKEAATLFLRVASNSNEALYSHVKCLIEVGQKNEAIEKLNAFDEEADEFVGEIELADLYLELECYKEAIHWFEKGLKKYSKDPYWVSRFIYSLFKTKNFILINDIVNESILQKNKEIKLAQEEECEEDWTENDKESYIKQLIEEKIKFENMFTLISSGQIPLMEFEPSTTGSCYLFGCKLHNHPEYQE